MNPDDEDYEEIPYEEQEDEDYNDYENDYLQYEAEQMKPDYPMFHGFPSSCAVAIIVDFLKMNIEPDYFVNLAREDHSSMVMSYVNQEVHEKFGELLLKAGFELKKQFLNKAGENRYLYIKPDLLEGNFKEKMAIALKEKVVNTIDKAA